MFHIRFICNFNVNNICICIIEKEGDLLFYLSIVILFSGDTVVELTSAFSSGVGGTILLLSCNAGALVTFEFYRGTGNSTAVKVAIPLISFPPPP